MEILRDYLESPGIVSGTCREGLVDADMLVTWLLQHLGRARRSPAVTVCLVPLLQLCIQVICKR